jgi:CheY-like chemotaxis protein
LVCLFVVRTFSVVRRFDESVVVDPPLTEPAPELRVETGRRRILLVDDDPGLRLLLRTTLGLDEFAIEEASSAEEAAQIVRFWLPAIVILDVALPGMDGFRFCRELKLSGRYEAPFVLLLTGQEATREEIEEARPDAVLRKPFSPIELVGLLDRLGEPGTVLASEPATDDAEQLLVYARDLSALLAIERRQRRLLQQSYRQTVIALAGALEAKDPVYGVTRDPRPAVRDRARARRRPTPARRPEHGSTGSSCTTSASWESRTPCSRRKRRCHGPSGSSCSSTRCSARRCWRT